jgi:hypothetical protein
MIQISLEITDKPGELSRVVSLLGGRNIDVKALYVSRNCPDPATGYVRMIVTDPNAAIQALQAGGLAPAKEQVVVAAIADHPGGLAAALAALAKAGINLTYAYGFVSRLEGSALSVLGVQDPAAAARVLKAAGITLVGDAGATDPDLASHVGGVWNW